MNTPIVIVGGTGGIGQAICRRLRAAGTPVHLIARDEGRLASLASETGASFARADATDANALRHAIAAAGPSLSGLVYAAGTINLKPLARLTLEDVQRDMAINAFGAFHAVQAALPGLKANDGISGVVLFSTIAVGQGFPAHASVAMAKGAVEGVTRSLAAELAPKIRVNCIAPSLVDTPLAAGLTSSPQMAQSIAALHPMQRLGRADDVAAVAALLLSPEAGWITGQVIHVDGGRSTLRIKG
jgi:NAD(P)-dependent dehydrogenase (short-subunit alcohol dehydrogenase family)